MAIREEISTSEITEAVEDFSIELVRRLKEKGAKAFASTHEILGVLEEELMELKHELHTNNKETFRKELLDIAVGAVFGAICVKKDKVDW